MILTRYLDAIDNEITKEKDLFRIQVHAGYRATIERYIANSEVLTLKDLWCILSLYSTDVPDAIPTEIDGVQILYFIPQPRVTVATTTISFVPQPRFTMDIPVKLQFIPQPRVAIESITLEYVPQPRIIIQEMLQYVPQPRFTLENVEIPIIYVPQPRILGQQGIISFVPQPRYVMHDQVINEGSYFWGFTPYSSSMTRASYVAYVKSEYAIDLMLLTENYDTEGYLQKAILPTNTSLGIPMTNWEQNLPVGQNAYMVFLIPARLSTADMWSDGTGTTGPIGGVLNENTWGNHFPDPDDVITYQGKDYYLYVGNRRRRNSGTTLIHI